MASEEGSEQLEEAGKMSVPSRHDVFDIFRDHIETWGETPGQAGKRERLKASIWYLLPPTLLAIVLAIWRVCIMNLTPFLTGLTVFTALLFGLLILIFNTGVSLQKDKASLENAHNVAKMIADLRANISYTAMVAVTLVMVLVLAIAMNPASQPIPWGWTIPLAWLGVHLLLNLLNIVSGLRRAFRNITT
ncbi:hypothetical protein FRIG_01725 [Frigoribacterium faeni]|uniref:hypothetical protein n=1 Tax=Frigoribacterium faeni TaxID=145483 RepID=UPI001FADB324|nr:hypothetical protein [Frigoribacterium faeni]MCJ0699857.1 hypothetical protein [Frigoribacterium faeni]